jgi:hypothetical protein
MFRKTHITGLALVVVVMALATPVALGNDGLVDDWFRGAKPAPEASIGLIDVTAQDVSRPLTTAVVAAAPVSASSTTGFGWGEFGIGAAAMLGAVLLLVGLGAAAMRHRGGQLTTS